MMIPVEEMEAKSDLRVQEVKSQIKHRQMRIAQGISPSEEKKLKEEQKRLRALVPPRNKRSTPDLFESIKRALIEHGKMTIYELENQTKLPRQRIYNTIQKCSEEIVVIGKEGKKHVYHLAT